MTATYDNVRDAVLHLPKGDQARILAVVAMEMTDAHPGIDFQANCLRRFRPCHPHSHSHVASRIASSARQNGC